MQISQTSSHSRPLVLSPFDLLSWINYYDDFRPILSFGCHHFFYIYLKFFKHKKSIFSPTFLNRFIHFCQDELNRLKFVAFIIYFHVRMVPDLAGRSPSTWILRPSGTSSSFLKLWLTFWHKNAPGSSRGSSVSALESVVSPGVLIPFGGERDL